MNNNKYCQCKIRGKVTTDFDDWYEFDRCCTCGGILEDSIEPLNHMDGEDFVYDEDY